MARVGSRARLILVPLSCRVTRHLLFDLSLVTTSKAKMATSMDVDGIPSDKPAAPNGLPQVQEHPIAHTVPPLSNGMPPFLMSARFSDCRAARLDPPRFSGSQHREPFREISVKVHIRRPERDSWVYVGRATVSLDTTGHSSQVGESPYAQLRPTQNRSSEPVRSGPLDRNGEDIGGVQRSEFLVQPSQGRPARLLMNKQTEQRTAS
jgi:hypothetical protein